MRQQPAASAVRASRAAECSRLIVALLSALAMSSLFAVRARIDAQPAASPQDALEPFAGKPLPVSADGSCQKRLSVR